MFTWNNVCRLALCAVVALMSGVAVAQSDEFVEVDIEAQDLSSALTAFGHQTKTEIAFTPDTVSSKQAPAVKGEMTRVDVLDTLLADTSLEYHYMDNGAVIVRSAAPSSTGDQEPGKTQPASSQVLMAQNQTSAAQSQTSQVSPTTDDDTPILLEEIIVVGSNIRGAASASPTVTFDREDIDRSGIATTEQFVQTITQNFGGGLSELRGDGLIGDSGGQGIAMASGINLRGLGSGATLVLLNGHRLAETGLGNGVDLSQIPLNAIERIDVLTDGASAIYGADAVGGVVNITTRKDFSGADTRLTFGTVTDGDHSLFQFAQAFGKEWDDGQFMASYTYRDRSELRANDRSFSEEANDPFFMTPDNEQHNVFISASQRLTDDIEAYVDVLFSSRDTDSVNRTIVDPVATTVATTVHVDSEQLSVGAGVHLALSNTWAADIDFLVTENSTDRFSESSSGTQMFDIENKVLSFGAKVDGTLFQLPGGSAKLAIGGRFRQEDLAGKGRFDTNGTETRDISAFFAELYMPIVGESNSRRGISRLEFTAAARHENYSDFGGTTNPKFGLLWSPVPGLSLRGTWGTSFRAPRLSSLSTEAKPPDAFTFNLPDDNPSGSTATLIVSGANEALRPEEATVWTAGIDIQPQSLPNLNINMTYFDIEFTDRMITVLTGSNFFSALTDPTLASLVNSSPTIEEINSWVPFITFDGAGVPFDQLGAILDGRLNNVANDLETGVDISASYDWDTDIGFFGLQIGGTYLFERESQLTALSPSIDKLDTVFNPVDLKLRNSLTWRGDSFGATVFVNHVSGYEDRRSGLEGSVDSWTTVDLVLQYNPGEKSNTDFWNVDITLSINNALDEEPPFVDNNSTTAVNFDPTNASAVGRFVSLNINKRW